MQAGRPYSPCTLCGTTSSTILLACSCLWSDTAPLAAARPLSPLVQPAAAAATAAVSWGMGCSSKVGGWAFCGRTPCLLVWLRRRTLEEAPSGQSTGAQGDTRVCLLGEYEFNRPRPEPESLSVFREGHWGSILPFLLLLENEHLY